MQSFVACAVEMITERECLTLYYDSVEELRRLACFEGFFASSRSQSRVKCITFTLSWERKTIEG